MWQMRALMATKNQHGKLFRILLQTFIEEYTAITVNTWEVILRAMFGIDGFNALGRPFLIGRARIELSGRVTSEVVDHYGMTRREAFYRNQNDYIGALRRLADHLKLKDIDRVEMFATMSKWITEDRRVGLHGEKVA